MENNIMPETMVQKEINKRSYIKRLILCAVYAVFFTVCLYKNPEGIMYPFFALATIVTYLIVIKVFCKEERIKLKKYSYFLMILIMLLAIHVCTTGSEPLIIFDKVFIFISMFVLFLSNIYDDRNWDVSRYISAMIETLITACAYLLRPITDGANLRKYGSCEAPRKTYPTPLYGQNAVYPQNTAAAGAMQNTAGAGSLQYGQNPQAGSQFQNIQGIPAVNPASVSGGNESAIPGVQNQPKKTGTMGYVFLGLAISVPLLCIVLPLLSSSDAVFNKALTDLFTIDLTSIEDIINTCFITVAVFIYGYALLTRFTKKSDFLLSPVKDMRNANPVVAITISSVMLIFYLIYCAIQIIFLFLGFGTLPEGYTYAKYAHEGFFQLVFVCLINLVLVLVCRKFSKDNAVLKALLTTICACTYIMLFSSAYRMMLYISVYGLTFLRVYVLWALSVIALVMLGAVALIFNARMPFVKYSLTILVCTWLVFSFSYPDKIIAEYNLSNRYDLEYTVKNLSSDAVPVIMRYRTYVESKYNEGNKYTPIKNMDSKYGRMKLNARTFNFSKHDAINAVKATMKD